MTADLIEGCEMTDCPGPALGTIHGRPACGLHLMTVNSLCEKIGCTEGNPTWTDDRMTS